jgi:hypothetical protein
MRRDPAMFRRESGRRRQETAAHRCAANQISRTVTRRRRILGEQGDTLGE